MAKLVLVGVWYHDSLASAASAGSSDVAVGSAASARPEMRGLLQALRERQEALDVRERAVVEQEQRLQVFEKDVTGKLATLEEIEARLGGISKAEQAAVGAAAESLAKIYATMKPAEAAPILDQLDDGTVLAIFGAMKEKQIGQILPLMSRERAIALTRSLASRR